MTSRLITRAAIALSIALAATACSSSDGSDEATATTAAATTTTTSTVAPLPTTTIPRSTTTAPTTTVTPAPLGFMALTGVASDDEAALTRPVLAAKIDNVDAARPQAGVAAADVVFEEIVEGGLTRLLAVFHTHVPDEIGPIRSARSTDVPLLTPMREPLFAWSGANAAFAALIRSVAIRDVGVEAAPDLYRRAPDRPSPSNLMTSAVDLYASVELDGDLAPNALFEHLAPGESAPTGEPAASVTVDYGATEVTHTWDGDIGGWVRTQNGTPHLDADGSVVAPTNVIVQFVEYLNSGLVDSSGAPVPEADLDGTGPAWFLIEGQVIEGTWTKPNVTATSQYLDADGEPIRLVPGSTWVLLARADSAELS